MLLYHQGAAERCCSAVHHSACTVVLRSTSTAVSRGLGGPYWPLSVLSDVSDSLVSDSDNVTVALTVTVTAVTVTSVELLARG